MRKLIYSTMVLLDGFVARPDGALDWVHVDEELHTFINNQQQEMGLYCYGRRMYEVLRYWETADQDPTLAVDKVRGHYKTPERPFASRNVSIYGRSPSAFCLK